MERKLLLLGLLRMQAMYGYQLNELIDTHLGISVHLKKPTAYRLLDEMAEAGWVHYREEKEGARPPRRVYALTPQGEAAFQQMLRESLADYKPAEFRSSISLVFLDAIPPEEVIALLHKRRSAIETLLETMPAFDGHHPGSLGLMMDHQRHHLAAELAWLDGIIARLRTKATAHDADHPTQ